MAHSETTGAGGAPRTGAGAGGARRAVLREWDGASYDRISGPMEAMGLAVLERMELKGDELVLDAGCGSGRITESLLARLPRGRVIAVDQSPSMIEAARARLGAAAEPVAGGGGKADAEPVAGGEGAAGRERRPRVQLRTLDLLELSLEEPLDAILSTATFHWISDHERLFARLHAALRPGGALVAQCGGEGNISILRARIAPVMRRDPYAEHFTGFQPPWNYASAELTHERLTRAGFRSARCWLAPAPQQPDDPREYLSTIVLGPHVQRLPVALRGRFMDDALQLLEEPVVVDYVRLNIDALA